MLLGLNGAGKTTLFSLITRLYGTRHGIDRDLRLSTSRDAAGEALRRLGVVFQARTLDLDLSVAQNLLYHAALHGMARARRASARGVVLRDVGLADRARRQGAQALGRADAAGRDRARAAASAAIAAAGRADGRARRQGARRDPRPCRARWSRDEGVGVLWATHLIDEIDADDDPWSCCTRAACSTAGDVSAGDRAQPAPTDWRRRSCR